MKLVMQGIHIIYGDTEKFGFLHRQVRGLLLLLVTIAPLLGAAILGVLGKPLRRWIAHEVGKHAILQGWWNFFFPAAAMVLGMMALTVIYRVARAPGGQHAQRLARSDARDAPVVGGGRGVWSLRPPRPVTASCRAALRR